MSESVDIQHHFSVDVEEYFQVAALESIVSRAGWDSYERRASRSVDLLLDLLARYDARGTFFILGWLAERDPELVRRIAEAGHEVASHGWDHRRVMDQSVEVFRDSVRRTRQLLEDQVGTAVIGFRAPSFSIVRGCEWALDVLIEEGYRYDSSLFPVRRPGYGYANGARDPYWIKRPGGVLAEAPPATVSLWGLRLPAAGGGYFRLLPYALVRSALRQAERRGVPATFYIHPWELDAGQPRLDVSLATRIRHYGGLNGTRSRLERLLTEFRFRTIAETVNEL